MGQLNHSVSELALSGPADVTLEQVCLQDVAQLWALEQRCFTSDRLSQRRMRHYVSAANAEFILAREGAAVLGYALLLLRRGTLLTRLYSIAVAPEAQGKGIATLLVSELERRALSRGKQFMRLEVAEHNSRAIRMYTHLGFSQFGVYSAYYADESNAVRMQKALYQATQTHVGNTYPYYQQTTDFTCGPAALMMAMHRLSTTSELTREHELRLWRQSTTIFMTSGHGGCHPVGLALAARQHGFDVAVWLNKPLPMFTDGVRSEHKKAVVALVEKDYVTQAEKSRIGIDYNGWNDTHLHRVLQEGAAVICLISTYAFDRKKAPHWVAVTGIDDRCVYINDPDISEYNARVEHQHIPIAKEDFMRLASYGTRKFSAAVIIKPAG